jgi:hypothetical protein
MIVLVSVLIVLFALWIIATIVSIAMMGKEEVYS